jgi:hypothetical protein
MIGGHTIEIDRVALTLDGVSADDARLLAGGLRAAIEAQLAQRAESSGVPSPTPDAGAAADVPLVTALRGQALVDAVAARLVTAFGFGQEAASWR